METGILTEDNGNPSTMRLIAIILVMSAVAAGGWIVYKDISAGSAAMDVFNSLLLAGVGGKGGQKVIEVIASQLLKNKEMDGPKP